ncbi:PGF-CTERM sorting domain-containing protein [Methanocorpusculum sp. MG]|uniref:PGF-CTERM sorting domain-containing protein n=1 Tax=Methanocorpusculum petauri TaxID=3002863 RepID=A0ABT4IG87_9EURY|nr:MEMAR_RS02690 family S-layer glycoprotein [Methanocorpusculum petauri]MCZ0860755.1 PGF-CTERM sorting domain-containing protein [Methanocorpusculum petauri]
MKNTKIMTALVVLLAAALCIGAASAAEYINVSSGNTTFVFEKVNLTDGTESGTLTLFSEGSTPAAVNTIYADSYGNGANFSLYESSVNGHYGVYYNTSNYTKVKNGEAAFVYIWYPEISLKAELTTDPNTGATSGDSIDGKTINKDTVVSFLINTPYVGPVNASKAFPDGRFVSDGKNLTAKIIFTTPAGGKTTDFNTTSFANVNLNQSQNLAGYTKAGSNAAAGTWTAQAEFTGYKPFADNEKKKSNTISFTLQSTTLTITAAKDSVVRSNPFTVAIQGESKQKYAVYIESPATNEVNPTLQPGQSGFQSSVNNKTRPNNLSSYSVTAGFIYYDGYSNPIGGIFETDASGKRTIQFNTAADTEDKTYTIKVSSLILATGDVDAFDSSNYDKVKVKVEKGAVTIAASGDGSYYIGEEIKLTGTNTDSDVIYLFVTGQNLLSDGVILKALPNLKAANQAQEPGDTISVKTDDTWEYKWDTTRIGVDTGAYTIYATSKLTNGKSSNPTYDTDGKTVIAAKLSDSEYATISVNLKQPFLSAIPSATVIAQGDKLYIRGTAEGSPSTLKMYLFGPNYFNAESITVEDDGSYEKKFDVPADLSSNQYFVVIQHPMYNGEFDAKLSTDGTYFYIDGKNTGGSGTQYQDTFVVKGTNKLQGSQAADALTKMIDDANIDDIYTKLTFTVAAPYIRINNPGDQAAGSTFTISGVTNLAVDDQILVEVMSSSFTAIDKTSTSTTSGVSQTTKVVAGDGTENAWSVEVDTTNWKLDEYTIKVNGIEVDVSTTTNFNLVEKVVTPTPTATSTGVTPTTTATATATATPSTPGFGAFIALAGLGAVALLVLRRN